MALVDEGPTPRLGWHRAKESCDCASCQDVKNLARERDSARKDYEALKNGYHTLMGALQDAEAETQALREALEKCLSYEAVAAVCQGLIGCTCINQSRDTERNYETGNCVHQKANATLQRLTPASPRTGEK